ncbi:hypothetical protein N1851_034224 [Merluccius polli]|uniref:Uncharacterized protein n=1 Tax=Merluccius polli TaxID=89951 RepID=A0AA47M071_MERPO|nr:hypothetical protein N1851_034224 [Merluccius polli]
MEWLFGLLMFALLGQLLHVEQTSQPAIVYSRQELLELAPSAKVASTRHNIPAELLRKRRRVTRAGIKRNRRRSEKAWRRTFRPALPSIIMGNVRSLNNKFEELEALVRSQKVYRESSLLCFSETLLKDSVPVSITSIYGFRTIRADRDTTATDYINFCTDVNIPSREIRCYPNNKTWVTSNLKALLNQKKEAFRMGDRITAKEIQRELKVKIKEGKQAYSHKLEQQLQSEGVTQANLNHLRLNISKTKEMVLDFRRRRPEPDPVSIQGTEVELVSHYKYLGVQLDNKLDWSSHTEAVYKRG